MSQYFKSIVFAIIFCATCFALLGVYKRETAILNNQAAFNMKLADQGRAISEIVTFINQQIQNSKQPQKAA